MSTVRAKWLTVKDNEIEIAKQQFDRLAQLAEGSSGAQSKHHERIEAAKTVFDHLEAMKQVELDAFIETDEHGNIKTDIVPGVLKLNKKVDSQLIATIIGGFCLFLEGLNKSKKIRESEDAIPVILALQKFILQIKADHASAIVAAQELLKNKRQNLLSVASVTDRSVTSTSTDNEDNQRTPSPSIPFSDESDEGIADDRITEITAENVSFREQLHYQEKEKALLSYKLSVTNSQLQASVADYSQEKKKNATLLRRELNSQEAITRLTEENNQLKQTISTQKSRWKKYLLAGFCIALGVAAVATGVGAIVGVPLLAAGIGIGVTAGGLLAGGGAAIAFVAAVTVYRNHKAQQQESQIGSSATAVAARAVGIDESKDDVASPFYSSSTPFPRPKPRPKKQAQTSVVPHSVFSGALRHHTVVGVDTTPLLSTPHSMRR